MLGNEKLVQDVMASTFRTYFDEACRINGIYTPHSMDGQKLKQKWELFKQKCPENYEILHTRYLATDVSWEDVMRLYYRG